jgi:rhodanese-related sulfurtransferase
MSNPFVSTAAVALLLTFPAVSRSAEHTTDSLETVKENVAAKKAVLVDVREPIEWRSGHVVGAVPLPYSLIERRKIAPEVLARLPKDRILYTHCVVGMRSKKAAEVLEKLGYQVRALKPGYDELQKAGFATVKGE